MMMVMMIDLTR